MPRPSRAFDAWFARYVNRDPERRSTAEEASEAWDARSVATEARFRRCAGMASHAAPATIDVMSTAPGFVPLHTSAPRSRVEWELEDGEKVPVAPSHNDAVLLLSSVLAAWVAKTGRDASIEHDIALRWDRDHPKVGVDPDIAVFVPALPDRDRIQSAKTWLDGHAPPILAVEVVSTTNPKKDYGQSPEKYAANGTEELWVFDPRLAGPRSTGGPFLLQVWRRADDGGFERVYAGAGPARSPRLDAWIVVTNEGKRVRVADDPHGRALWPTLEEEARADAERERQAKEREREAKERECEAKERAIAEKDAALAELAALKAELARRST